MVDGSKPVSSNGASPFSHPVPAGAAKSVAAVMGEIVWLMSQSPAHKSFFISDLEWFVMTPVLLQQFRLFYDQEKPIGVDLPDTMELKVVQTEPTLQKATASAVMKPATLETGLVIQVPPFVNSGDKVKVDTSEARYVQRVE